MRDLALAYYFILRGVLRERRHLRACLVRCRHCRIFFLADPRNRGRKDLGCPFGCREAHRRKRSAERSAAYYRTQAGKVKKAALNSRRRQAGDCGSGPPEASARIESDSIQFPAETRPEDIQFPAEIVEHVRMVTSLIEGVDVSREQVVSMLERTVRQRRILREGWIEYALRWLAGHPPGEAANGT